MIPGIGMRVIHDVDPEMRRDGAPQFQHDAGDADVHDRVVGIPSSAGRSGTKALTEGVGTVEITASHGKRTSAGLAPPRHVRPRPRRAVTASQQPHVAAPRPIAAISALTRVSEPPSM